MATFLDIGLLQKFEIIFPFLFVLVAVWGVLSYAKFLGDNKFLHALISLILAVLVLFSDKARRAITGMAPWFVLLIIFIVFLWMLAKAGGLGEKEALEEFSWLKTTVLIVAFVILVYNLVAVSIWDEDTEYSSDDVGKDKKGVVSSTLRNPLVLGLILIFLVAVFTIQRLAVAV